MDSHRKSILKAVTWRGIATLVLAITVYLFTEKPVLSISIAGVDIVAKFILYYMHERVWLKIRI